MLQLLSEAVYECNLQPSLPASPLTLLPHNRHNFSSFFCSFSHSHFTFNMIMDQISTLQN